MSPLPASLPPSLLALASQTNTPELQNIPFTNDPDCIIRNCINQLSFKLLQSPDDTSAVLSSMSLLLALGMLIATMDNNCDKERILCLPEGSLTKQLEEAIHKLIGKFNEEFSFDKHRIISSVNFFVSGFYSQNPAFARILSEHYHTEILHPSLTENAAEVATEFVSRVTEGQITKLFNNPGLVKTAMGNVLLFQGAWTKAFNESNTVEFPFYCSNGRIIKNVKMMQSKELLQFTNSGRFTAISKQLKHNGEKLNFIAIKPNTDTSINDFDSSHRDQMIQMLAEADHRKVNLMLPKIEIDKTIENLLDKIVEISGTDITSTS